MFIVISEMSIPYNKYSRILCYLSTALFAYIATAIIVGGNWQKVLTSTIVPILNSIPTCNDICSDLWHHNFAIPLFLPASEDAEQYVIQHKIKEIGNGRPTISKKKFLL